MAEKKITRYFLIQLAFFVMIRLAYLIDPSRARSCEEEWKKEIWILEDL